MTKNNSDIFSQLHPIQEIKLDGSDNIEKHFCKKEPFIIRDYIKDWPLVKAAKKSGKSARDYLLSHHIDRNFTVTLGDKDSGGKIFYNEDMSLNIKEIQTKLPIIFDQMDKAENMDPQPVIYLGSTDIKTFFKDLSKENNIDLGDRNCLENIWVGTKTIISAHNDFPDNVACVAAGKRRFTLFPPEEFKNLYIGPIVNTPAGRPISMIDFHNPDFDKFPNFKNALNHGQTSILNAGDAIFIPTMWWHHVEALEAFNILVNYWWQKSPLYMGNPQNALFHAIMSIRDLPKDEKKHWEDLFQHHIFNNDKNNHSHIPKLDETLLGEMDADKANKIRSYLLRALNQ